MNLDSKSSSNTGIKLLSVLRWYFLKYISDYLNNLLGTKAKKSSSSKNI